MDPGEDRYFYHAHGCGSGKTKCVVKWAKNGKITLQFYDGWMGTDSRKWTLAGDALTVDGETYSVLCFAQFGIFLDAFRFGKTSPTEWGQDLPIGLYCGNGCYHTEEFALVLVSNRMITDLSKCTEDFQKRFPKINGMKLMAIPQSEYEKVLVSFQQENSDVLAQAKIFE